MEQQTKKTPVFVSRRKVLFGECDPDGVVYTPRYSDYVIEASHDFLSSIFDAKGSALPLFFEQGVFPPARALSFEFLKPISWDDEIELQVWVESIGRTSFTIAVEGLVNEGDTAFSSRLTQVCVSSASKEPMEIPESLQHVLYGAVANSKE